MAKKDKQAKKDKPGGGAADAVDAIRSAIERTLEGAGLTDKRQQEVVEQVHAAAGRIRQTLDDLRVVDEVRDMRAQLETLAARVAELEASAVARVTGAAAAATGRARSAAARGRAKGAASTAAPAKATAKATAKAKARPKSRAKAKASASTRAKAKASSTRAKAKQASTRAKAKPSGGGSNTAT